MDELESRAWLASVSVSTLLPAALGAQLARARELVIDRLSREQLEAVASALEPVVEALDPQHAFAPTPRA